jgi:LysM repeat protein
MKINTITQGIIFEDKTHRSLYEDWQRVGRVILERQLTDQEIQQMFQSIQTSTAWNDAGGNRTRIGKGVDAARSAAGAVSGAWNKLKDQVYNSSAMSGFATHYDRAAEALKQATGGDQGLMQYVQKYRDFAEKHPIMQKAVYAALVAAAGMAGAAAGPAGIGAAVGLMQTFDKAIQGQDIRKALWSGAKAGAAAYGTAKLVDFMQSANAAAPAAPAPAPTGQETVIVAKGQTLSDIAQNNGVSVKDMMAANPQITNPDVIRAGQELVLPSPTGAPVYQGGIGTAADTAAKIGTGQYTPSSMPT